MHRQKQALLQLKQSVESRVTYAEEARQAGVVPLLTRLLGITGEAQPRAVHYGRECLVSSSAVHRQTLEARITARCYGAAMEAAARGVCASSVQYV